MLSVQTSASILWMEVFIGTWIAIKCHLRSYDYFVDSKGPAVLLDRFNYLTCCKMIGTITPPKI
jgi:hypothetical protein